MKQEDRISEILHSLDGIQGARAPQGGFAKIQQKLSKQKVEPEEAGYGWLKFAAVIAFVVSSNIWVISNYVQSYSTQTEQSGTYSTLISDYNLYEYE